MGSGGLAKPHDTAPGRKIKCRPEKGSVPSWSLRSRLSGESGIEMNLNQGVIDIGGFRLQYAYDRLQFRLKSTF